MDPVPVAAQIGDDFPRLGVAAVVEDPDGGKELSLAQFNAGADIVHAAAGRTGIGAFDAAIEKGEGFWVVIALFMLSIGLLMAIATATPAMLPNPTVP